MGATSNAKQVVDDLRRLILSFGFDKTIEGRSIGQDCVGVVADGIAARSIDAQGSPDGSWPANEPKYKEWKRDKYGSDLVGVRTGQMLSIESLKGGSIITTHDVEMQYGTGLPPTRSYASAYFDPRTDGSISDIEKAFLFSKRRPFYVLDDAIADGVLARLESAVAQYLIGAS